MIVEVCARARTSFYYIYVRVTHTSNNWKGVRANAPRGTLFPLAKGVADAIRP